MGKITAIFLVLLCACSGSFERKLDVSDVRRLENEPKDCRLLHRIEVDALVYSEDKAIIYLENRISEPEARGNAYWITSMERNPDRWKIFGQEWSIKASVYKCPLDND